MLARDDNPRLFEIERRVQRGRILDHNDRVLAETTGPVDELVRVYPLAESGPVVGYYSFRFGTAGIENAYDAHLRGQDDTEWHRIMREVLHESPTGGDVRLTLDAELQETASLLMTDAGATGGLVLLELTSIGGEAVAEIRAMVSLPGYDPNRINDDFDRLTADVPGPLFNRSTQGLYQPGLILQSLIIATAVDDGILLLDDALDNPYLPVAWT